MNRRGFLGLLTSAGLGVPAKAIPIGKPPEKALAFHFVCHCGQQVVAQVPRPEVEGAIVTVNCACGVTWKMTWMGDHFHVNATNYPDDAERSKTSTT